MSSRYSPYRIRNVGERRRVQERLLSEFNSRPVTAVAAVCAVCLETYCVQSNNIIDFLMPSECTHLFCYKCVLNMYKNAMNVPRAAVSCPMCNKKVGTWQAFFPNSVVSCKFIKKTGDRTPACLQFMLALKTIQDRYMATEEEAETEPSFVIKNLQAQLDAAQKEARDLQESMERQKQAHNVAWNSSCEQVTALQTTLADMQAQLDRSEALSSTLAEHNRAANVQIDSLRRAVQRLEAAQSAPVSVNVEFNDNARQNTNLHERFRSYVYSTVSDMMIEDSIKSLQSHVFGAACLPCSVNVEINFPFDE
ncbi:PE38 [Orgyia pseudotsugata multiple nucleopolyhedrovirus]|uniref:Major immediate early protein n=1 Tax=Orgyia pseudotsugata multicapsid polyhedrosis virus TaxID=262177 RepID=PE38_NPVOP|nr:PE38 [Orgyia pseudotsugata multiple nucleopolyhedrovirus]P32512.1 RecName: Full=Major immediate early protein; AltName: Full=PE-38 [Orgyia pseudotsugata multiple nucleopolyhedrovirus]pir/T10421/ protein PE38 - Orgyia pseudotsugata nuclear polyhedrosis virus [Orgyia pseudotsugata single capsid nuclopolyhedrovirus]AAA46750.1 ORF; homologous to the ACMNPV PE-38 gene; putative [Orgyia pseudotsugata single capsid nuclopolyhedrovirus]AAC59151.1 PE38 [Orgyia pseudotsugata multiple nucleopolyhedrovi